MRQLDAFRRLRTYYAKPVKTSTLQLPSRWDVSAVVADSTNSVWFVHMLAIPDEEGGLLVPLDFTGFRTGSLIRMQDLETKFMARRQLVWEVTGTLGMQIRMEKGYIVFEVNVEKVKRNDDFQDIIFKKEIIAYIPRAFVKLSPADEELYFRDFAFLPISGGQQEVENVDRCYTAPERPWRKDDGKLLRRDRYRQLYWKLSKVEILEVERFIVYEDGIVS